MTQGTKLEEITDLALEVARIRKELEAAESNLEAAVKAYQGEIDVPVTRRAERLEMHRTVSAPTTATTDTEQKILAIAQQHNGDGFGYSDLKPLGGHRVSGQISALLKARKIKRIGRGRYEAVR